MKYEGIILTDVDGDTFAIERLANGSFVMKAALTASGDVTVLDFDLCEISELYDWLATILKEKNETKSN